jgi:Kdo2-lipid IVA lauroyltransferase/acyltransferase
MATQPTLTRGHFHPRHWLTWLMLGVWRLTVMLPYPVLMFFGRQIGKLLYLAGGSRRTIVERNLELCFPELDQRQRTQLVKRNFENYGMSLFELPLGWWASDSRLNRLCEVKGLENIDNLDGQGALLMTIHFVHIDLCAQGLVTRGVSMDCMYRVHNNPVFEYVQSMGRMRRSPGSEIFSRKDVRGVVKALRRGRLMWYAPDQDFGKIGTVFVPFFGIPASTVTATSKFATLGNAKILPFFHYRRDDGKGYVLEVQPPLEGFPAGDDETDAVRINQQVENFVRQHPEQYLWAHRRFKNRPEGEPSLYYCPRR